MRQSSVAKLLLFIVVHVNKNTHSKFIVVSYVIKIPSNFFVYNKQQNQMF